MCTSKLKKTRNGMFLWLLVMNNHVSGFGNSSILPKKGNKVSSTGCFLTRKEFVGLAIGACTLDNTIFRPRPATASNLPSDTGANQSKTGTVEKLIPIVDLDKSLKEVSAILRKSKGQLSQVVDQEYLKQISAILKKFPNDEKTFKRRFDEYSEPVSYKSKYLDSNAFLVYYTKGFDGPNRESIESGEMSKQILQYGARNEVWNAFDDMMVEIVFALKAGSSTFGDLLDLLNKVIVSLDAYIQLAPIDDVHSARKAIDN